MARLGAIGKLNFGDLNSSLFTDVDYDDVTLAALDCAFVDLIVSAPEYTTYNVYITKINIVV